MMTYVNSNADVLWDMIELHGIKDDVMALQLLRDQRIVRSDASDGIWKVPDDYNLTCDHNWRP